MATDVPSSGANVWRDLSDPRRAIDTEDLQAGLKDPEFTNLDIPESFGPITLIVDDHKIKRFAFTQNDYSSWHFEDSPFGGRIGHAALLANDLLQLFTTRYAASRVVGLHTEQELHFLSPVHIDEKVTLSGTYVDAYERRGQGYVVMEAQAAGEDGRTLLTHRGVEILRTVPGEVGGRGSAPARTSDDRITGEVDPRAEFRSSVSEGTLQSGMVLAPESKTITFEQAAVFSRIGEFVRNIHNDPSIAKSAGLRLPIVQGQQQVGLLSGFLSRFFGEKWFTHGWIKTKFLQPLEVFESLTISGLITEIDQQAEGTAKISAHVWIKRSDGSMATVAWAHCQVPI